MRNNRVYSEQWR